MKRFCKPRLSVLKVMAVAAIAFAVLFVALEFSGVRRFRRYCDYPNKDALLSAESANVVDYVDCMANGGRVAIVDMGWIGFLPSGSAMLVYDADGKLIDFTAGEGENSRFQQKWSEAWNAALMERTRRWLVETRMPELFLHAPTTMQGFVSYMEQASRDYDRPDRPKNRRGLRFRCSAEAGKVVFPEKSQDDLPILETLSPTSVSFFDAVTNACRLTDCQYRISTRGVYICK